MDDKSTENNFTSFTGFRYSFHLQCKNTKLYIGGVMAMIHMKINIIVYTGTTPNIARSV